MRSNRREALLKIGVAVVVGLFLLDKIVITPFTTSWKEQDERIASLREKVRRGQQLVEREKSIRGRWADMLRTDLPEDGAAAENEVFKGVGRWARESRINFTSLTPQWKNHDEGFDTLECRGAVSGDQGAIGRLMYELESDRLPARLEECEITARDAKGQQLTVAMRFSFIRLNDKAGNAR
ncbi:hypothetical protein ACXR0O_23030 [Verrucomicrobiota bacterium sgz303538]